MSDVYDPDAILADPAALPIHKAYAAINVGIRDHGERWSKCANCGYPYQLTETWDVHEICSDDCDRQYVAYLNNPSSHSTTARTRAGSTTAKPTSSSSSGEPSNG